MISWLRKLFGLDHKFYEEPVKEDAAERAMLTNQPVIMKKERKQEIRAPQFKKRPGRPRKKTNT